MGERRRNRQTSDEGTGDRQTGPWVLALGVLAIGVGALVREARRQRKEKTKFD